MLAHRSRIHLQQMHKQVQQATNQRTDKAFGRMCLALRKELDTTFARWGCGKTATRATPPERENMLSFWRAMLQHRYPNKRDFFAACEVKEIFDLAVLEHAVFYALGQGSTFSPHREHAYETCAAIEAACGQLLKNNPLALPASASKAESAEVINFKLYRASHR